MDPKERFSTLVDNYVRYRPSYPLAMIETLQSECGLTGESVIADVGSGTGILSRLFLDFGCKVYGIEPNQAMRTAAERLLAAYPRFFSRATSAEMTGLDAHTVDFVTAGQAFHWFDPVLAREEFKRILVPGGWVALAWNERRIDSTPFLRDYEALLQRFATDYNQINHRNVEEDTWVIPEFFGGVFEVVRFDNQQVFDYQGLEGRLLSSSYAPGPDAPDYQPMLAELHQIFERHEQEGKVIFELDTRMFYGKLG